MAAPLLVQAHEQRATTGQTVRLVAETTYQAGSWDRTRRVVDKAEALDKGPNTRFVVTTRRDPPVALDDWSVDRGAPELWSKDVKRACRADRLSDCRFWANQFRLLLHAAAYGLLDTLRRWLTAQGYPPLQLDTLRLHLLKVGGRSVNCSPEQLAGGSVAWAYQRYQWGLHSSADHPVGGKRVSVRIAASSLAVAPWPVSGWRLYGDEGTLVADGVFPPLPSLNRQVARRLISSGNVS